MNPEKILRAETVFVGENRITGETAAVDYDSRFSGKIVCESRAFALILDSGRVLVSKSVRCDINADRETLNAYENRAEAIARNFESGFIRADLSQWDADERKYYLEFGGLE